MSCKGGFAPPCAPPSYRPASNTRSARVHDFTRWPYDQYGSSTNHTRSSRVVHGPSRPRLILHGLYVCTKLVYDHTYWNTTKNTTNYCHPQQEYNVLAAYFILKCSYFSISGYNKVYWWKVKKKVFLFYWII